MSKSGQEKNANRKMIKRQQDKKRPEYVTMTKESIYLSIKVLALLYSGRQLIRCESLIDCEPLRGMVDQPDIRRSHSTICLFIHYTSMKSWKGYVFITLNLSVCLSVCDLCLSVRL